MLVGHPGERDEEFEELKQFVSDYKFDRLGVFTYSHEEGTAAYELDDHVPTMVKAKREEEIMEIQYDISLQRNQQFVGKELKVMIDRLEGGNYIGRTEFDSPEVDNNVLIPIEQKYLRIGDFVKVRINQAEAYDLIGTAIID